ncbi:transcriptional repressor [Haematospirillum sp. H1815]|uniref:Fur family transcriptional regulator n=1 Tax=Haematospirillum sp. H1815 TaxID=2723108 RepID=UPI001439F407|nr:Fur family transcriptional regulator [Haematospirillum sp. H1815]NKD77982.1 transcriptional repressor [Haematospirillum sp. H1815]
MIPFPAPDHDHRRCRQSALDRAESLCVQQGARLTAARRQVLEILWEDHRPVSAYGILHRLNEAGGRVAPMAVYRALDFLVERGLAHRLNSLNAFVACSDAGHSVISGVWFFICSRCGQVAETQDGSIARAVSSAAGRIGFAISAQIVEIMGVCPDCFASPVGEHP